MKPHSSHKKRWLLIAGGLLLLILFVIFVDLDKVVELLRGANWVLWLSGTVLLLAGYLFNAVRWRYFLKSKPEALPLFHGDSIAYMGNMITPIPTAVRATS